VVGVVPRAAVWVASISVIGAAFRLVEKATRKMAQNPGTYFIIPPKNIKLGLQKQLYSRA
jgi:hypothetical protein